MHSLPFIRRARFAVVVISLGCLSAVASGLWHSAAVRRDDRAEAKRQFIARVRDGVGSEVRFARHGDDDASVRASVESVAQFMRRRSGVDLHGQTKSRLAEMEQRVLSGAARRLTGDELSEVIAATAMERIAASSEEEIARAAETLRGFDAPDLPASFRGGRAHVNLRTHIVGRQTPEEFIAQVKAIRDANSATRALLEVGAKRAADKEVQKCTKQLAEAVPEQFGSTEAAGYTPLQAVLIVYSVVSDDPLADSAPNLEKRLKSIHEGIERVTGQPYPRPAGHRAYGPNGYVFSTPLDLLLDEQTVNRLLDHMTVGGEQG